MNLRKIFGIGLINAVGSELSDEIKELTSTTSTRIHKPTKWDRIKDDNHKSRNPFKKKSRQKLE